VAENLFPNRQKPTKKRWNAMLKLSRFILAAALAFLVPVLSTVQLHAAQVLFTPELVLTQEYSDNIFLTPDNEEEDFISSAGLGLSFQFLGRTAGLELNYTPTFSSFADNSDLNYWRHEAGLRTWNDFTRNTRFEITNSYLETENPQDGSTLLITGDPFEAPIIGTDIFRRGRTRYRTNIAQARLSHQFGANDNVHVGLRHEYLEDIDTFAGIPVNDYTNIQPFAGFTYGFAHNWSLQTEGYYSSRDYTDRNDREEYTGFVRMLYALSRSLDTFVEYRHTRLDFEQDTDNDFQIYSPSAGFRYQFQENAHILLGAGYYIQDIDNRDDRNEGWLANSEIFKRWAFRSGYVDLTGTSGYTLTDTGTADEGLTIFYQARLALEHNFTNRFSANAYAAYRYNDYPEQQPNLSDQILNAGAGLRYQALQWMSVGLSYTFRDFSSDAPQREYTENRAMLSITMRPASPYRWN
jgi:hypothetical protein